VLGAPSRVSPSTRTAQGPGRRLTNHPLLTTPTLAAAQHPVVAQLCGAEDAEPPTPPPAPRPDRISHFSAAPSPVLFLATPLAS
jgi:hypothetical protein